MIIPKGIQAGMIWMNGNWVEEADAKIHILTHSLHYSGAVFEGIKCYNGKIFKLKEHIERLFRSAESLFLSQHFSVEEISQICEEAVIKNNLKNAYIRPLIWRGSESMKMHSDILSTNIMVAGWASNRINDEESYNLTLSYWRRSHPTTMPIHAKSASMYNMMTIALIEAENTGFDDAILLDLAGNIAECTTTNIFFIKDNLLITPNTHNCIEGITRATVIEFAPRLGYTVIERDIKPDEIKGFDACFATGTAAGIRNIKSISYDDEKIVFDGADIVRKVQDKYSSIV